MDQFNIKNYDYPLQKEFIAETPLSVRDSAKMLVFNSHSQKITHQKVSDLLNYLQNSVLVLNETKVIPARLLGKRKSGAQLEVLLLNQEKFSTDDSWYCKVLNSKKIAIGEVLEFFNGKLKAKLAAKNEDGRCLLNFFFAEQTVNFLDFIKKYGLPPLPPYILKRRKTTQKTAQGDHKNYQTVYAANYGSIAAPTAGLHFTKSLLTQIATKIPILKVTLHIGLGTFEPIKVQDFREHNIQQENYFINKKTAEKLRIFLKEKKNIIAIGTTTTRVLETLAETLQAEKTITKDLTGKTNLFIYPPYKYKVITSLITNFHLPQSSLMILVAAMCGLKNLHTIYETARKNNYRFYSYGDCMLLNNNPN